MLNATLGSAASSAHAVVPPGIRHACTAAGRAGPSRTPLYMCAGGQARQRMVAPASEAAARALKSLANFVHQRAIGHLTFPRPSAITRVHLDRGRSSGVEHNLAKVRVGRSIRLARSRFFQISATSVAPRLRCEVLVDFPGKQILSVVLWHRQRQLFLRCVLL